MAKRTVIEVTQEDIDKGEAKSCGHCPIALALLRQFPKAEYAHVSADFVDAYSMCFGTAQYYFRGRISRSAYRFMHRFDNGLPVEPFKFYSMPR